MVLGKWISTCKRIKLDLISYITQKINSKWNKDLNVRCERRLEDYTGKMLLDIGLGNSFLEMTLKAQATKAKIDYMIPLMRNLSSQTRRITV